MYCLLRSKKIEGVSNPGEFHPQALLEPDVNLSAHPAPIDQSFGFALLSSSSHKMVDHIVKPVNATPSLHLHYRDFNTTTSCPAPVPRIGTLTLAGSPLGFLPYHHRDDRFPRSAQEPRSGSRHLYAGRHPGGKQVSPGFILGHRKDPSFDVVHYVSTPHQWFAYARLPDPHLPRSYAVTFP